MNGDFLGFSFDGIHSSRLGITRVSDGNRYNESLTPELEDKIIPIPGKDGNYFFGSSYAGKPFTIQIAFDSLSESQFRQLNKLLAIKKPCRLIFDERPYKVYMAKISAPPQLSYICFDEKQYSWESHSAEDGYIPGSIDHRMYTGNVKRTYKGEGTIEFICTQPFAIEQFKKLDEYGSFDFYSSFYTEGDNLIHYQNDSNIQLGNVVTEGDNLIHYQNDPNIQLGNVVTEYTNINEWAEASGILPNSIYSSEHIDTVLVATGAAARNRYTHYIPVYNPGDIDSPFYLYLPYTSIGSSLPGELNAGNNDPKILIDMGNELMVIEPFTSKQIYNYENGVVINTRAHTIEGVIYNTTTETWSTTGNIYNEYILAGDFGVIEGSDWNAFDNWHHKQEIYLACATAADAKIHYNYLYY